MKKLVRFLSEFFFWIQCKRESIKIGRNYRGLGIPYIKNKGSISIGDNFNFNFGKRFNPIGGDTILRIIVRPNACLKIGSNCGISNSTLNVHEKIIIKNNVIIGGGM